MIIINCDIEGCNSTADFHEVSASFQQVDQVHWQVNSPWGDICPDCAIKFQDRLDIAKEDIIKSISTELKEVDKPTATVVTLRDINNKE